MEQKESFAVQIVTNFNRFAEFHAVVSQKLGETLTIILSNGPLGTNSEEIENQFKNQMNQI